MAAVLAVADGPLGVVAVGDSNGMQLATGDGLLLVVSLSDGNGFSLAFSDGGLVAVAVADSLEETRAGAPTLPIVLRPVGVTTGETFGGGAAVIVPLTGTPRVGLNGISTGQAFGVARVRRFTGPAGVAAPAASLFPSTTLRPSTSLLPGSSGQAGTPRLLAASHHAFQVSAFQDSDDGAPVIPPAMLKVVYPAGLASTEAFGTATVSRVHAFQGSAFQE